MRGWVWWAAGGAALLALALCRRPLAALCRLAVRSGLGMVFLRLFQGVGVLLGIQQCGNLLNGTVLRTLGPPGLALLRMTQLI